MQASDSDSDESVVSIDEALMAERGSVYVPGECDSTLFGTMRVCESTASLWGRRVTSLSIGNNVAFATTDTGDIRLYSGGTWVDARNQTALQNLPELGINATADSTNRLSISSDAVLLNHAGAGHQVKVNKASTADTASLLFQSNWSGRAEMGLSGTDDFAVKISADGNTWTAALSVDATNGNVTLAQALTLTPAPTPTSPTAGMLYFDGTTTTLRCYDGNQWYDLF